MKVDMRDDEKRMRYKVKLKAFLGENEYSGLKPPKLPFQPFFPLASVPPEATQLPMPQER